ncbi:hypothetical protein LZ198_01095 [Myxococcus sp. K15C18031901]|uniref:hypothetical protein n=1 Tax=Myxococcus dinghuensis TaxID=2906761 RepID=UPI0020A7B0F9|nr:hypothetical protein [Myxococcus dinghuensis]MCP3097463.1 hypothetical protein [Myxococcus dinghuensis]
MRLPGHLFSLSSQLCFLLTLSLAATDVEAGTRPRGVQSATSVVGLWSPAQHLYVKGDVGVSGEQLAELEVWLTENAPHWTVVLVDSARGERYVDAEGTAFSNVEAVLHSLGKGLSNRTRFGSLRHPETGEQDGTILVVSLRDRDLSYFGSDAQDLRGLGEASWKGDLDQRAIKAMRDGGRVVDAVMGTIHEVDGRLGAKLVEEAEARGFDEAALELARQSVRAPLLRLQERVARLSERLRVATAEGPLPGVHAEVMNVPGLEQRLLSALTLLEQPTPQRLALARVTQVSVRSRLEVMERWLDSVVAARGRLSSLEQALRVADANPLASFASSELATFRATLESARAGVRDLGPTHPAQLAAAERARDAVVGVLTRVAADQRRMDALAGLLDGTEAGPHADAAKEPLAAARKALDSARAAFARQDPAYVALLQEGEARAAQASSAVELARWAHGLGLSGGVVGGLGLLAAGFFARRRRNRSRGQALELHTTWRGTLDERIQRLLALQEHAHRAMGASREELERRFEGASREEALRLAAEVDALFLRVAAAARVLQRADVLLAPRRLSAAAGSQLSTAPYEAASALLRDELITLHPDESVEAVLHGLRKEVQLLLGEGGRPPSFSLSFPALVASIDAEVARVQEGLAAFEGAPARADSTVKRLEALVTRVRGLPVEAGVPRGAEVLACAVAAAEATLEEARRRRVTDPLGVEQGPLVSGQRLEADLREWWAMLASTEANVRAKIDRAGAALAGAGLSREWLDTARTVLAASVVDEARAQFSSPTDSRFASMKASLEALGEKAVRVLTLVSGVARTRAMLEQTGRAVDTARAEVGAYLHAPASRVFREDEGDVYGQLARVGATLDEAQVALGRGALEEARAAVDASSSGLESLRALVSRNLETLRRFEGRRDACLAESKHLEKLVEEASNLVGGLTRRYLESALVLRPDDPVRPEANGTVEDNPHEMAGHLAQSRRLLAEAEEACSEARLLAVEKLLDEAEAAQVLVVTRREELQEKARRLQLLDTRNKRALQTLEQLEAEGDGVMKDVRVPRATLEAWASAREGTRAVREQAGQPRVDPHELARGLATVTQALEQARRGAEADVSMHEQVTRNLASVEEALRDANVWVGKRVGVDDGASQSPAASVAALASTPKAIEAVRAELARPHGDWHAQAQEVHRIESEVARAAAVVRGEVEAAEKAVALIREAELVLRQGARWDRRDGRSHLSSARELLSRARYLEAQQAALAAIHLARAANEAGERRALAEEVRRKQKEVARLARLERARLKREEAAQARRELARAVNSLAVGSSWFSSHRHHHHDHHDHTRHVHVHSSSHSTHSSHSSSSDSGGDSSDGSSSGSGSGFESSSW